MPLPVKSLTWCCPLGVIADADEPDTGVIKRKKGMTVGYLSQDPKLDERSACSRPLPRFNDLLNIAGYMHQ